MKEIVNFAIIGLGSISTTHIAALKEIDEANLVAVYDRTIEKAKKVAAMENVKGYSDIDLLLKNEDIDAVIILTASGLHADLGIKAAQAKKHVIVEKPIDINVNKARDLIEHCKRNNVKLSCIFQHRFDSDILNLKKAIDENKLGKLNSGCCHTKWFRPQEYYNEVAWRGSRELGGGALINQGIHQLDLFQYLMGDVEEVYGYAETLAHVDIDAEDVAMAVLKFKNGAIGILEANVCAYPGFNTRIDISGNDGTVILENNTVKQWKLRNGEEYAGSETVFPHKIQLQDIVSAIKENREPAVNGEEALKSLILVDAIYKSSTTGKPIKVNYNT
ncbi:Gfo/Idh/MocA family protein [Tepidanaerobacter syntrophicus]|uniref:Dehydrogenase n=2 Tax=Tepidanaerobacter syntrophicus TaxID=224999 RepID=A0A0U9HLJ1_9FIRM|nr:Gfo/Idh/MocA family oxidoreductase [Tepidanaerobacter syntrophicus]GAQ24943.1 dehydrogenase [Tepidanaerobacter syntrophicus]